ncbi:hypothetical protein [Hydrotalea sp.]|uniref:hypothetical protein n=1 Tax=Hydrotalea sp. TaxID=2881279 RepID=UPI00258ADBBF|nr:hypothetical protein [Hydrotalea sp.]
MQLHLQDRESAVINLENNERLVVGYKQSRALKDAKNRNRGVERLQKQIKTGKLTKSNINNEGYNKYLKMEGELKISIDIEKYEQDARWDGLKG